MNPGPQTAASEGVTAPPDAGTVPGGRRPRFWARHPWLIGAVLALVLVVVVRALLVESFYIPSASMEPGLRPADRVVVEKIHPEQVTRGQVVVFDGTQTFAPTRTPERSSGALSRAVSRIGSWLSVTPGETDYVKRVIGMPGDRVACCSRNGDVTINGTPVDEPYVKPGDDPSDVAFDVRVPAGHIWVMGDHRSDSDDSRAHLGDPGGGMVPLEDVIGRVAYRYWPLARAGTIPAATQLSHLPEAVAR